MDLKDENFLRQPKPTILPDYMKDKSKFCMFHNDYGHTFATFRNLYAQLRVMMRKGQLLKYLKQRVPLGSLEKSKESERITIKVTSKGAKKDLGTNGSAEDLNIVLFVRKLMRKTRNTKDILLGERRENFETRPLDGMSSRYHKEEILSPEFQH